MSDDVMTPNFPPGRKALAWMVHLYTALGLLIAAGILILTIQATDQQSGYLIRWVFLLMLIATLVDATDGTMARLVQVKKVLPGFDGRRLDDLIDFINFTCLPLFLIYRLEVLPAGQEWCLGFALLASAYGFCQVEAKTADGYFLGFPSYWNLVAFYLYVLQPLPPWVSMSVILLLAFLTFVPLRYLYPSQRGKLNLVTNLLGCVWIVPLLWTLFLLPQAILSPHSPEGGFRLTMALISLFFPLHYMVASWWVSWAHWKLSSSDVVTS